MGKRSPILGFNHNVRHRGLVFHVQTEDSGVDNPHIFTHLFHGGVIISTRKLTYDRDAAEDAVKSLMQAQHKAALKELKSAKWDAKIDSYLGGTPGLEPAEESGRERRDTLVTAPPPEIQQLDDQVTPPAGASLSEAVLSKAVEPGRPKPPTMPPLSPQKRSPARHPEPDEVSAAFRAISLDDAPSAGDAVAVPVRVDDDETTPVPHARALEIEAAAAPAQAASPDAGQARNARVRSQSGAYSQIRAGRADRLPDVHDQPTAPVQRKREGSSPPPLTPMPPVPPSHTGPAAAPPTRPAGKAHAPAGAPARAAGKSMPVGAAVVATGGTPQPRAGVVVSRPAVIIGGPPKVIGSRDSEQLRPIATRRAREDPPPPRANLFGKDLISEKSLDEVILAYLSEDSAEE